MTTRSYDISVEALAREWLADAERALPTGDYLAVVDHLAQEIQEAIESFLDMPPNVLLEALPSDERAQHVIDVLKQIADGQMPEPLAPLPEQQVRR